jgi:acetolactate synthase I/II/III large subunit
MASEPAPRNVGEALLARLAERGVDYVFANPGTDFPPLIEALAAARPQRRLPKVLPVPHENLAMAMAHGHTMVSGRPQAVMLHVNVGLANAVNGLINANRANLPMLLMSGRTPLTEQGPAGARSRFIHWAQEMFDQAGMVRENAKWSFELTSPDQLETVVDRALAIAASEPAGPVYLSLPREPLAAGMDEVSPRIPSRMAPAVSPLGDPQALAQVAEWLGAAERPLIITSGIGRTPGSSDALARLAEVAAVPVVTTFPRYTCLPIDHPMHVGFEQQPFLGETDLVLVVECDVPWIPQLQSPPATAKVVQLGFDPLFARYPLRGFPADLTVAGDPTQALAHLAELLAPRAATSHIAGRRAAITAAHGERLAAIRRKAENPGQPGALSAAWVSRQIDDWRPADSLIISEMGAIGEQVSCSRANGFFGPSPAGGLGWGLGAALGAKLAVPERPVICTVGDGSYMFGNPTPAHWVARAHGLPVLFVVFDNAGWAAVRAATRMMYPEGAAAAMSAPPLTDLRPSPAFEQVVEACGGLGQRVERPEELKPALERAMSAVAGGRQALVNIACAMGP